MSIPSAQGVRVVVQEPNSEHLRDDWLVPEALIRYGPVLYPAHRFMSKMQDPKERRRIRGRIRRGHVELNELARHHAIETARERVFHAFKRQQIEQQCSVVSEERQI